MKHLAILHGDKILFDGEVAEITYSESENAIQIKAILTKTVGGGAAGGLMELLANAARKKQEDKPEQATD